MEFDKLPTQQLKEMIYKEALLLTTSSQSRAPEPELGSPSPQININDQCTPQKKELSANLLFLESEWQADYSELSEEQALELAVFRSGFISK